MGENILAPYLEMSLYDDSKDLSILLLSRVEQHIQVVSLLIETDLGQWSHSMRTYWGTIEGRSRNHDEAQKG